MIVNAPLPLQQQQLFQDYPTYLTRSQQQQQQQQLQQAKPGLRFNEDASEILGLVLVGGPKWGFRIKQLNDNRVIVSRIDKGAAEKCGLKVNDELLSVNNVQLSNSPRSLLLQEYPQDGAGSTSDGGKTPLTAEDQHHDSAKLDSSDPAAYLAKTSPIELSKLDFTYQLIKHSSISNKLMLTVKRFLSPAYARASVAAATSSIAWHPHETRSSNQQDPDLTGVKHQVNQHHFDELKRPHTSAGYNCCDCYCDKEGK